MKVYYVRHQAAGVCYEFPFDHPPTKEECAPVLEHCKNAHGEEHKKTGKYWAKVVCAENGKLTTVSCAHGGKAEDVDAKAAGSCPIREAGLKRWPDADPKPGESVGLVNEKAVTVAGVGRVDNP